MAGASLEPCQHGQLVMFEEATHWVYHEYPVRVNALLETFLRTGQGG
jgi:epoxide hydrolase 4